MNIPKLTLPRWGNTMQKPHSVPEPAGVIPLSLVRSAQAASWIAYFCLVYLLWLYTLDIARDRAAPLYLTHVGGWVGELRFWFPYIIGFAVIAVGIPYVAKIAIPIFMSLDWRTNAWPKAWSLFIAMSVSLVVFAGTFTIQGDTILEKGRDAAVAVAQVEQGKAVLQAQISAKEAELKSMMENRNAYLAQAASVGADEWQRSYIDRTPANDAQRDRIVRALGAARAADATRAEINRLRIEAASQTTVAAVSERVEARAGVSWVGSAIDWIQGIRAILLSLVMDIVALLMPWIALRLQQARERQLGERGEDPPPIMIEDHSAEAMPQVYPYTDAVEHKEEREIVDPETGEKYKVKRRREHWVRAPKTKKSGRKVVDPQTGKKVEDSTEYEAPATQSRLNEVYEDGAAEHSGMGGALDGRHPDDRSRAEDDRDSDAQTLTPEPEEKADGRDAKRGEDGLDHAERLGLADVDSGADTHADQPDAAAGEEASANEFGATVDQDRQDHEQEAADRSEAPQAETLTPEPEEKADVSEDRARPVVGESNPLAADDIDGAEHGLVDAGADDGLAGGSSDLLGQAEEPAPLILADEEVAPPVPIDDDRLDELVAKGVASEDENGFVTFHSQEDQPSIEQPDQTYNYPRLPAPKEDVAA